MKDHRMKFLIGRLGSETECGKRSSDGDSRIGKKGGSGSSR
jgi:hypothetical protein